MARGSITPRGNSFRVRVSYQDDDGKRHMVTKTTSSIRQAEKLRTKMLAEIDKGNYRKPSKELVADYLASWLNVYVKPRLTPRSYERYSSIVRLHIIPFIGTIPLMQLRTEHLQKLYTSKLNSGQSPRSVRYIHVVIHKALNTAMKWGKVSYNAADGTDVPKARRDEMHVWNEAEMKCFLDKARSTPYHTIFYLALYTGARRGELLALRWQDCDFKNGRLSINRTITQIGTRFVFGQPKSERSRRTIAVPQSAMLLLRQLRERAEHLRQRANATLSDNEPATLNDNELIFTSSADGKTPLRPNTVSRAWENLAKQAGVKVIRFHEQSYPRKPYVKTEY